MSIAYQNTKGENIVVPPEKLQGIYSEAKKASLTIPAYLNREFADADPKLGTAAQQLFATAGLVVPDHKNPLMLRPSSVADILDGKSEMLAGPANTKEQGTPFGSASRILFPAAVIASIESALAKDRETDSVTFEQMITGRLNIGSENFEQPVIDYSGAGGPEKAKAQRVSQLALPPAMLTITTADKPRRLASYAIGMEMSEQALRATSLDLVSMVMKRFLSIELDDRVYRYVADLFNGNDDLITGAVGAVTTTSLDSLATGGVVTHKSWVKFLARNRKVRKVTHVIGDIDTYLKVESRTGRPGSNNYDPTLVRIDPQAAPMNVGFGNDVKWFIVDAAADGGPVPANTVYALDSRNAITKVTNTSAAYTASEEFVLKRSSAFRTDWAEDVYRTFGDTDLRAFDKLTIA